jgi:hypothetical protein
LEEFALEAAFGASDGPQLVWKAVQMSAAPTTLLTRKDGRRWAANIRGTIPLIALREGGDALAHACTIAPEKGAGTLVWVRSWARAEAAIVLEPEEALPAARLALHAASVALADALGAYGPPDIPLIFDWPARLRLNGALVGQTRLGLPSGLAPDATPPWLVVGIELRFAEYAEGEPGETPDRTSLLAEGYDDVTPALLVAAWAAHSRHTGRVVGALLVFRLYYYIVPLFLAGLMFAAFEVAQRRHMFAKLVAEQRVADALEVPVIAGLVGLGGTVLIFLGALPTRSSALPDWAGYEAAVASHFAASVVGSLLLVMAYGLLRRLKIAWGMSILLLLNGALICWLREDGALLWGAFLLVALLVGAMRGGFYRDARLMREPLQPATLAALGVVGVCAILLALVSYGGKVGDDSWL